ncbi:class I SAM-dependent methyltransferase [Aerococcus sp. UMB1112A]|uniref:class I SAM-dependent DNA methyltransferase n=1 Tax=Aerococcus sp. UMB1112A TaxID=3050609 RepID=UPI002551564F|nr:class I SAM-dependent methyltransferase [Aerococcus sp. UMB1112A]MDK8502170.1 class I SAM-dependent methyltransferase [Aerococcus sp. UMB1112A]
MADKNYQVFQEVYDLLFDKSLYPAWADFCQEALDRYLPGQDRYRLLDVACGDGEFALEMLERGFDARGYDLSEDMVDRAQARLAEAGYKDRIYQGNMLEDQAETGYDLLTLFCDSLCYLEGPEELSQCFMAQAKALKAGGLFIFDIHSAYQMNQVYPGYQYIEEWDDAVFTWRSEQVRGEGTIDHLLNIFVEDPETGYYERHEELHREQIFPLSCYQDLLKQAGFVNVQVSADFSFEAPGPESQRLFFTCVKEA